MSHPDPDPDPSARPDADPRPRWDDRHRIALDRDAPLPFLLEVASSLPGSGTAVDLAGGRGTDALWLAARGLATTLVDVSPVALARATERAAAAGLALTTVERDLESDGPPAGEWDVVLMANFWHPQVLAEAARRIAPGGVLIFCQPTVVNLERHEHPSRRFLVDEGEAAAVAATVAGIEIVSAEERWWPNGRHEVRLLARRSALA